MISRSDLQPIRDKVEEARIILTSNVAPGSRVDYALELLRSSVTLTDKLMAKPTAAQRYAAGKGRV
ncbi:MAG TPA: hypothetical protein VG675_07070 [Bryobacteraceae bacterium]|nr:hypothetical protein [Bryobacteraceae bacterium]